MAAAGDEGGDERRATLAWRRWRMTAANGRVYRGGVADGNICRSTT
jgi:hypothetical protein